MGSRGPVFVLATCAALGLGVLAALVLDDRRGGTASEGRAAARVPLEREDLALAEDAEPREEVQSEPTLPVPADLPAAERAERELVGGTLAGTVLDPRGMPLGGAHVTLERRPAATFDLLDLSAAREPRTVAETRTDERGRFRFPLALGTPVDVHAVLEGFSDAVRTDAYAGQEVELVLAPGTLVHGVVTRLRDGEPVANAKVNVFPKGGSNTLRRETTTRGDGSYELRSPVARGVVEVVPALERCSDWIEFEAGPDGRVQVDVVLAEGLTVEGVVRDAETGAAIADATVGEGWWYRRTAKSDAAGRYRLPGFGDPGVLELYARANGYGEAKVEALPAPEAGSLRVDWQLSRGRTVRGRIVTAAGEPVPQAYVGAVASEFGDQGQRTDWIADQTDERGRFALGGLAADLGHSLLLARHGFATVAYDLPASELTAPDLDVGDLVLPAPALVAGRVVAPGGGALAGIEVVLDGWNADRFRLSTPGTQPRGQFYVDQRAVTSDAEGRFWFGDVAAGEYELATRVQGRPERRGQRLAVAAGARMADLELVLDTAGILRGRVQDEDGHALAGVYVSAHAEHLADPSAGDGGHVHDRTEADGFFELTGLSEGVYTLQAWPLEVPDVDPDAPLLSATLEHVSTGAQEIALTLPRGASIRGRLLDAMGAPLVGYVVTVRAEDRQGQFSTTDLEGRFALTVVPATSPDVEVRGPAQSSAFQTVFLVRPGVAAGTHDLELRLP